MGSFSIPCAATRIPINEGDQVVGILVDHLYGEDRMYALTALTDSQVRYIETPMWGESPLRKSPVMGVYRGTYDDAGSINGLNIGGNLLLFHEWAAEFLSPGISDVKGASKLFIEMRKLNLTVADLMCWNQWPEVDDYDRQLAFYEKCIEQIQEIKSNFKDDE